MGIPLEFIDAIRLFYNDNAHFLRLHGSLFDGPTVYCGVRQGCPLSGLLFAICADVILLALKDALRDEDEVARAFADDTAVVVSDYAKSFATIAGVFREYEAISGLELNIKKTVFIPLWPIASENGLRNLLRELCPLWANIRIDTKGKYLGFMIGPGAGEDSWNAPLRKFEKRLAAWQDNKCGLVWNSIYYNTFMVTTLEFIAQLADVPEKVEAAENAALRKLAPGPGTWITKGDLENLDLFGIGQGFRTIEITGKAAKLRLMNDLGDNRIREQAERIRYAQSNSLRRPFGRWHDGSFAKRLCDNQRNLRLLGMKIDTKAAQTGGFQKVARKTIASTLYRYDMEHRIRCKIGRWKFADPPGHVALRLKENFKLFQNRLPPAVIANYLRVLWNGIPTSRRMATMPSFAHRNCVFDCSRMAQDSIEHYCRCPILHAAVMCVREAETSRLRPHCMEDFFGVVKGSSRDDKLLCARQLYVKMRLIHFARRNGCQHDWKFLAAIEWNKTGNKSAQLLQPDLGMRRDPPCRGRADSLPAKLPSTTNSTKFVLSSVAFASTERT
jgi:hypothetical protein